MAKSTRHIAVVPATTPKPPKERKAPRGNLPGGTSRVTFQAIAFDPPNPTILEGSPQGTFVTAVRTGVFAYNLQLIDDAGGRFQLDGNDIVAGLTTCDYESATEHTITVRCGSGVDQLDISVTIQVLDDPDDGGQDESHRLVDQNGSPILDQNGNYLWD